MPRSSHIPHTSTSIPPVDAPSDAAVATPHLARGTAPAADVAVSLLSPEQLRAAVESLLFVAGRPLEFAELRRLLGGGEAAIRAAVEALADECERCERGIRVQRIGESVQFVSAPENARFIAALLGLPAQVKLTTASLETLAVVAYRQPITRSQIEFIRGVNSDRALASLIQHGLVSEVGRAASIGRPVLFGTTPEFLQQFGLTSLDALPAPETPEVATAGALRQAAAQHIREAVGGADEPAAAPDAERQDESRARQP